MMKQLHEDNLNSIKSCLMNYKNRSIINEEWRKNIKWYEEKNNGAYKKC